jgi:hypothetical protein
MTTATTVKKDRKPRTRKPRENGRLSLIDAAHQVLAESGKEMSFAELYAATVERKLWIPGKGKTPVNTLRAQLYVHCRDKGKEARFTIEDGKVSARQA